MTIDCTSIERIFAPLRRLNSLDNQMLSLRSPNGPRVRCDSIKWQSTGQPPVSEWLGNPEGATSHDETIKRMRIVSFVAFMDRVPVLADGHPWSLIEHQAAGHA